MVGIFSFLLCLQKGIFFVHRMFVSVYGTVPVLVRINLYRSLKDLKEPIYPVSRYCRYIRTRAQFSTRVENKSATQYNCFCKNSNTLCTRKIECARAFSFYSYFVRTQTLSKMREWESVSKKRLQESTLRRRIIKTKTRPYSLPRAHSVHTSRFL